MATIEELAMATFSEWRHDYHGLTTFPQNWESLRSAERVLFIRLVAAGRTDALDAVMKVKEDRRAAVGN